MWIGRSKSPDETTEPAFSENISLVVCPFLGLDEDPGTSLGYAHFANRCHRLGNPVGIDLAHQNDYCLCDNFSSCYVYGQSRSQPKLVKTAETDPRSSSPGPDDLESEFSERSFKYRGLRVFGLIVMLLLIVLAAIVWWPPPGLSIQDVVVQGSSISDETADSESPALQIDPSAVQEQAPLESSAALTAKSETGAANSTQSEPAGETLHVENKSSEAAAETSLTTSEKASPAPAVAPAADEGDEAVNPEITGPQPDQQAAPPETAPVYENQAAAEEQPQTENEESSAQASKRQTADSEETEPPEAEEEPAPEADDVSGPETDTPDVVPGEAETAEASPAVTNTSIGPAPRSTSLQGTSNSPPPPLYLHSHPADGAEVLAMLPEPQPAVVLGRSSNGEWLLVRLAGGVEGWVQTRQSGASIVVSNLPVLDGVSGDVPAAQEPAPTAVPAEEDRASSPEAAQPPVFGTAVINSGALNLRSGPGLAHETVGVAYNGQQVTLLEPLGNKTWVLVQLSDGKQGWMHGNYLIQITWAEG